MYTLNCKGKLLVIDQPIVMGIINITPDSFYTGALRNSIDQVVEMAGNMLAGGAAMLDIGGQSTRPGSTRIDAAEEADRILPVIEALHNCFPDAILSIDTYHSEVAKKAVQQGASIVNDVSGGRMDGQMIATVASLQVPYIITHMQGVPETMQHQPTYNNVTTEVLDFFIEQIANCKAAGIHDIIVDPGFGFGKTSGHNFKLLKELAAFSVLACPLLAGLSRKGMIYKNLGTTAAAALNGTTCLHTIAILNGASILRVHDPIEAKEVIQLVGLYQSA